MTHTTEWAITVLCSHPSLIADVEAITANVAENADDEVALLWADWLVKRFPAEVQRRCHQAQGRRAPPVRDHGIRQRPPNARSTEKEDRQRPVSDLLEALADVPGDVVREIVEFVGEGTEETVLEKRLAKMERGNSRRMKEQKKENEEQRKVNEEQRKVNEEQRKLNEDQAEQIEALGRENEAQRREIEKLKGETSATGRKRGRDE